MENPIAALTELALIAAKYPPVRDRFPDALSRSGDAVIDELTGLSYLGLEEEPALAQAVEALSSDPDLEPLLSVEGLQDPMIFAPFAGGGQQSFATTVIALLGAARRQLFVQGAAFDESVFVRAVLQNYEELKRAARGEQVRAYMVKGLAGLSVPSDVTISTPWGVIRTIVAASSAEPSRRMVFLPPNRPPTTAVLVSPQLLAVTITRDAAAPTLSQDEEQLRQLQHDRTLTPLLFALASAETDLAAPVITFEMTLLPFASAVGYSSVLTLNPFMPTLTLETSQIHQLEVLATTLADKHHDNLEIASQRIVSAISQRLARPDALIDAVTAWESLVGTRTETVYRVTASLANLLEPETEKRPAFRKELARIYDLRSRVVHGDAVDPQEVIDAADGAIRIALRAMLNLYARGDEWLAMKSSTRSERLTLGY